MGGHVHRALNLLLVEEDDVDCKIIKVALSKAEIQGNLFLVRSGWECLRFLRKQEEYVSAPTPDVIIVDLNFLREGTAQLADLKSYTDSAGIPVIILADDQAEQHHQLLPREEIAVQAANFFDAGKTSVTRFIDSLPPRDEPIIDQINVERAGPDSVPCMQENTLRFRAE